MQNWVQFEITKVLELKVLVINSSQKRVGGLLKLVGIEHDSHNCSEVAKNRTFCHHNQALNVLCAHETDHIKSNFEPFETKSSSVTSAASAV